MKKVYSFNPNPEDAYIEITNRCNQKCPYCYNPPKKEDLDYEKIINIINAISGKSVTFSGGEPFLYEKLDLLLQYCNNRKIIPLIITNGTIMPTKKLLDIITEVKASIQLTIDSHIPYIHNKTRGSGSFESMVKFIEILRENNWDGELRIRMNIYSSNISQVKEVCELAKKINANRFSASFLTLAGNAEKFSDKFQNMDIEFNAISKYDGRELTSEFDMPISIDGCGVFLCGLCDENELTVNASPRITALGEVYPCLGFYTSEFLMGNVYDRSISDILMSDKSSKIRTMLALRNNFTNCNNCVCKSVCPKGCPASAYNHYNTILAPGLSCIAMKKDYTSKILSTRKGNNRSHIQDGSL